MPTKSPGASSPLRCRQMLGNTELGEKPAHDAEPPNAPTSWATMNIGTSAGAIPEKLFVSARAMVTAGLAKDVDAVNQ